MIFGFGIFLMLYEKFLPIKRIVLSVLFMIFIAIWLIELMIRGIAPIKGFDIAEVFSHVSSVALIWFYMFNLYSKSYITYFKMPFFGIALGNLVTCTVSIVLFMPNLILIFEKNVFTEALVGIITGLAQVISSILYAIGFWKTKDWVEQNPNS
jgi:hypothetical protein